MAVLDLSLDLAVGVVDDSQEHVEQDEEHKEDVAEEEDWTQDPISLLDWVEVEISEDGSKKRKDGGVESAKVFNLNWRCYEYIEDSILIIMYSVILNICKIMMLNFVHLFIEWVIKWSVSEQKGE